MAFFDNISKKLSQTGQGMVQKTKEMADVAKLNSNIADEEKKIDNLYYRIGQLYVSLHNEDFESDFWEFIAQLKESQEYIKKFKEEIQKIKGVRRCEICGAEIPTSATFCSSCGTAIIQQKAVDAINLFECNKCGRMIEKGMKFCTFCGCKVVVQQNEMTDKTCLSCGGTLADDAVFCTQCGTPVSQSTAKLSNKFEAEKFIANDSIQIEADTAEEANSQVANPQEMNIPLQDEQTAEKRCSKCGAALENESLFCTECGTKVN